MTDTDKDPQENIEKCFEEIKQVLKKHECKIEIYHDIIEIITLDNKLHEYYNTSDFIK